jgi:hypothetical protein
MYAQHDLLCMVLLNRKLKSRSPGRSSDEVAELRALFLWSSPLLLALTPEGLITPYPKTGIQHVLTFKGLTSVPSPHLCLQTQTAEVGCHSQISLLFAIAYGICWVTQLNLGFGLGIVEQLHTMITLQCGDFGLMCIFRSFSRDRKE